MPTTITLLPGDGIGPEVTGATVRVLEAVGTDFEWESHVVGAEAGISQGNLARAWPQRRHIPFDPETRLMATVHGQAPPHRVVVKGAPEAVLDVVTSQADADRDVPLTDELRDAWMARNQAMAARGLRVLALAEGTVESLDGDPFSTLSLVGLIGLADPPRRGVREAVNACQRAGMRVVTAKTPRPG